jgi:hypothetical protein
MSFPRSVRDDALSRCQRSCCICHIFCGSKIECHHIVQPQEGGEDSIDNCIPLCFDCHADVKAYNPKHPRGTSYSTSELRKHRDNWYTFCANNPVNRGTANQLITVINSDKAHLRDNRLRARNLLINFVDFCLQYPAVHSNKKSFDRTRDLYAEHDRVKNEIEMLNPLAMPELITLYSSTISHTLNLARLLDRQGGINPRPIDPKFTSVEDNIDGIFDELLKIRQKVKETVDPYLSTSNN